MAIAPLSSAVPMPAPLRAPAAAPRPLLSGPAGRALLVLAFINLFNYLDRFVVSALAEPLKHSELQLTDTQLGLLMTGFVVVYMLASPLFGGLGDRGARPRLVAFGVFTWSLATVLAGFAGSFLALFLARSVVGIGEAAYGTIAPSLLADLYPKTQRGRVMAFFFAAIPIGSALGYVLGGLVNQAFGWRATFFIAGAPGLLLAFLCLKLPDPARGALDDVPAGAPAGAVATYRSLLGNRGYLLAVAGYAAYTFAVGGMAFWMPSFLERVRGLPPAEATIQFGAIVVVTGFVGTFAGGWLGDWLLRRSAQAYLWLSGVTALLAAPLAWLVFTDQRPAVYLPAMVVAQLLIFASTGPINSAILNVVKPGERATAVALSILCIHLFGDVPSPPLIGWISDHSSLGRGVLVVPVAILVAGVTWTLEAWLGGRADQRR